VPTQPTYIEVSDKLRRLLASRHLDLQTELRKQRIDTQLQGLSLESRPQVREPFLIILAAGVTASLVGGAITRIIAAVSGYKHAQMTEHNLHVALNGKGDAIIDNTGNPVYNLAEKPTPMPSPEVSTARLVAGRLLSFDISTGDSAAKPAKTAVKKEVPNKAKIKRPAKNASKQKKKL
jgi:hypothetical protein